MRTAVIDKVLARDDIYQTTSPLELRRFLTMLEARPRFTAIHFFFHSVLAILFLLLRSMKNYKELCFFCVEDPDLNFGPIWIRIEDLATPNIDVIISSSVLFMYTEQEMDSGSVF